MKLTRTFSLMAAIAAIGALSSVGHAAHAVAATRGNSQRHTPGGAGWVGGYLNRAGWTDRRYRRAALKKRNKARHRAACRGRKA